MHESDECRLRCIERFYFREARLLDERQFKTWLGLLAAEVCYRLPARFVPQPDPARRGSEAYHCVAGEFSSQLPWREETALTLAIRAERALKPNAWAENPPARTRRLISNIEVEPGVLPAHWHCRSNFLLAYSRHDQPTCFYTGQRQDALREDDGELKIVAREVYLDCTVIDAPTLALFF